MDEAIELEGKKYTGIRIELGNLPLLVIKAKKGYVASSYVDRETAEKVGDVACFVSGVKTYDDMFRAKIREVTPWAEDIGIRQGMSVRKALEILDEVLIAEVKGEE